MAVARVQAPSGRLGSAVLPGIKTCPAQMRLRSAYRRFPGPPEATIGKMRFRAVRPPAPIPEPSIALGTDGLHDSPLEGGGFEPLVPRYEARNFRGTRHDCSADSLNRSHR